MAAYFQPMSYIRSSMEEGRFGLMGLLKCPFGESSFNAPVQMMLLETEFWRSSLISEAYSLNSILLLPLTIGIQWRTIWPNACSAVASMPYVLKDECQKDGSHNCEDQHTFFRIAVYPVVLIAAYCHGEPPLAFLTAMGRPIRYVVL